MWSRKHRLSLLLLLFMIKILLLGLTEANTKKDSAKDLANVTAIVDHQAFLPCDLSPPSGGDDEVYLVLWYKDDSAIPIYSLDARQPSGQGGSSLVNAKHVASDALAARSYFHTVPRPAHLLLEKVGTQDGGVYRCRVDFRVAKTRNSLVKLTVVVPPKEPVIKNQFGEVVQGLVGPYTESQRLLLVCDTKGGIPPPSVTWWSGTELLDDNYELTPGDISRNQLQVMALQRHHAGMRLVCQASNNILSPPVAVSVTLNVYLRPQSVSLLNPPLSVIANTPAQFVCRTVGSSPPANLTWWLESARLSPGQQESFDEGNTTTSVLTITPLVEDNRKELSCAADNSLVPGSAIEDSIRIKVHYPPQVSLQLGSSLRYTTIQEGHDVYFECHVKANPWVSEVTWLFEGHEIQTNQSAGIIISNQTLVLQRLKRESRGRYTCTALNELGRGESNPLYLRVQYVPLCKENQKLFYGVSKHKATKVTCQVEADPIEVSFRWTFNNSREDLDVINFVNEGLRSVATYIPKTDLDYGTLMCWGMNRVGVQKDPCLFYVVPAGVPDHPANCTVTNQTGHSFTVVCQPGDGNGLPQGYHLQVRDDELQRTVSNQSSDFPQFVVKDLPPGRTFSLIIYSSNDLGVSNPVIVSGVTLATTDRLTTNLGEAQWQQKLSSTVVILICLLVGLLLLGAVIAVAFRIRRLKTKSNNSPANKATAIRSCELNGSAGEMMEMAAILDDPGKIPRIELIEGEDCTKKGDLSPMLDGPEGHTLSLQSESEKTRCQHEFSDQQSPEEKFHEENNKMTVQSTPDLLTNVVEPMVQKCAPDPPRRKPPPVAKKPQLNLSQQQQQQTKPQQRQRRPPPRPPPRPPRRKMDVATTPSGEEPNSPNTEFQDFRQTEL